jgi:Rrf2 family transcriptional regulator, nitric oxide-sensitive transcriptional repressor
MQLLFSTDLALRTLMRLSAEPARHLNTERLARELCVSRNHLQKVVQSLADAGYLKTIRGVKGGVMLAKAASEITVGEVVRRQERDQAIAECFRRDGQCTLLSCCKLRFALSGAREAFFRHLDRFTLADCVTSPGDVLQLAAPAQAGQL